jgi:hypothetical protein
MMKEPSVMKHEKMVVVGMMLALMLAGCYPMEIPVARDGVIVVPRAEGFVVMDGVTGEGTLIATKADEAPAFAAISADGRLIVRAVQMKDDDGAATSRSRLIVGRRGEEGIVLAEAENLCFAQVSPDNGTVSYAFVSSQTSEGIDEALPELRLVSWPPKEGAERVVAKNVSVAHRWLSDGRIIFLKTEKKDGQTRFGALVIFDPAKNKATRIASVLDAEWFDVAPDGGEAVLSAKAVTPPGETPKVDEEAAKKLFLVDLVKGTIRPIEADAAFCRFSPDGRRVAILMQQALAVVGRDPDARPRPLMRGAVTDLENGTKVHLSWLNATEILALSKKPIFGVNGFTLELVAVDAETGEVRSLQEAIERVARR